ncbi:MAG: tetratricopeptide repeat protein [Candidatus Pacearchaeota archaeon]
MAITKDEFLQQLRSFTSEARKQEFIEDIIKKQVNTDVKMAALLALADLFISKKMFGLGARNYCYAGDLANTFREKMDLYFKGAVLYLRAADYLSADDYFRKVLVLAASKDKESIKQKILALYLEHAQSYEKDKQYTKAIAAYNRILMLNLPMQKHNEICLKLAELYERVGRPREAAQAKTAIRTEEKRLEERKYTAQDFI